MQRPLRLVHVLLLLVMQAAPAMAPNDAPAASTSGGITEIVLERRPCTGSCPVDTLVLRANGKAEYTGKQNTRLTGEFGGVVGKETFDRLAQWLVTEKFFQMQDSYGAANAATAGTVIRITRGGERKSVTSHAPDQSLELWSMGSAIRAVVADVRWQPAHSGIRGQAQPNEWLRITPADSQSLVYGTDGEGRFEVNLAPGTYSVSAQHDQGKSRTVVVELDRFTQTEFRQEAPPAATPADNAAYLASQPPPPSEDGLYLVARGGDRGKWMLQQDQRTIRLEEKTEPTILQKRLASDSGDNSTFLLELTIPYDARANTNSHVLVVGGKAYEVMCSGGGETSLICFRMTGEASAREVAKYFGVTVEFFTRTDYQLRVSITPTKPSFKRGEPITATLQIVNAGTDYPLFGDDMSTSRRDDYSFTARHNGQAVTDISFPGDRGGTAKPHGLTPGKTFEDTVNLGKWFEFGEPGAYQVHGSYKMSIEESRGSRLGRVRWTDYVETDFVVNIE